MNNTNESIFSKEAIENLRFLAGCALLVKVDDIAWNTRLSDYSGKIDVKENHE